MTSRAILYDWRRIFLLGALFLSAPTFAQTVGRAVTQVDPLIYSKGGAYTGCGIVFTVANEKSHAMTGSVVINISERKLYTSIKFVGMKVVNGTVSTFAPNFSWLETVNHTTRDYRTIQSEDAYLGLLPDVVEGAKLLSEALDGGFLIGSSGYGSLDATFAVEPKNIPEETKRQFYLCSKRLVDQTEKQINQDR